VAERKLGFFVKIKKDENFNHPSTICRTYPRGIGYAFHRAGADIGKKDSFRSGIR